MESPLGPRHDEGSWAAYGGMEKPEEVDKDSAQAGSIEACRAAEDDFM